LQAERAKAATQGKDAPGLGVEVSKGKSSKDFTKTFNECLKSSITDFCDSYNIVIPKELKLPVGGDNIYQIPTDAKSKDIEDVPPKEYNDIALYYSHKGKVNGFVSTLAKKIKDAFILKNKSRFLGGYTTGKKLDGSTLTRILRDDDRLFLQKEKEDKPSVCITLLLDLSGSMGHKTQEKIRLLSKSTIIFSEVLTKLKVPFEILAFTTAGGGGSVDDSVRSDYLYHMKIKEYDEAYSNDVKARIGGLTGHNNNLDAEALLWAYRRVKARPERDKFILVLSDGQPSGHVNETLHHNFLISLVKNITKKGITVIGIGYLHKGVERFYKNNLVIKDVQELPGAFLRLLKRCILKEKTKA
jgi:cobaltochelatase CobT